VGKSAPNTWSRHDFVEIKGITAFGDDQGTPVVFHAFCLMLQHPPTSTSPLQAKQSKAKVPELEEFLATRDYQGALALLQFKRHSNRADVKPLEWLAYCYFHFGEHAKVTSSCNSINAAICDGGPAIVPGLGDVPGATEAR
jgi:hypothetical protein